MMATEWRKLGGRDLAPKDPTVLWAATLEDQRGIHPIVARSKDHADDAITDRLDYLVLADRVEARGQSRPS